MSGSIGPLVAADEGFTHQIVDTFASVQQADYGWTEKVCGMVAARDGSLSIGFGFGKYTNRDVVDAYGGISIGVKQWTVRASRTLSSRADDIDVGPLRYEVIEPLHKIRVILEKNDIQPVAFDLVLEGVVPCTVEDREDRRTLNGYRHSADQIRYHQTGIARGWIEVDGQRHEVSADDWLMTRDHSWGIRPAVGLPLADLPPDPMDGAHMKALALWNPLLFQDTAGHRYAFMHYYLLYTGPGFSHQKVQGGFEFADGRRELLADMQPKLRFDPRNRRFLEGEFHLTMSDGRQRLLTARALGDTGFHLGAGLYLGFDGKHHGSYRGKLQVEGEHFSDCSTPESVSRLNQFRDCLIVVTDHDTGATGWGNCQTYVSGAWPEFGLEEK